jgi:hypothetical protein
MGFRQPDLRQARHDISVCMAEIRSPYNDGWTSCACKHDLYLLKCWLEEQYQRLPHFSEESQWEQQRVVDILKQS